MGLIPEDVIAEIRSRADIVAVVGEHVALSKSGASFKGLCPFHNERTPSFYVHPQKQFFHCFGCGEKGDVITFLVRISGGTFVEAVRTLAQRVDVTIPERERTPAERREESLRARLLEVNEIATVFYEQTLLGEAGLPGRAYLESRGLGEPVRALFRLGYAPDSWDALTRHLAGKKVPAALAEQTGVVRRRKEKGANPDGRPLHLPPDALVAPQTHFDFFRGRLMFPVISPAGEVCAFSGRIVQKAGGRDDAQEAPKYINSPESPVYRKGRMLYGLHAARSAIQKKGRAVLVEGNVDVAMMHQAGFSETVAPLGTALTPEQVETLRRMTRQVVLATDGDLAGSKAALKDIPLLLNADLAVRHLGLPAGEDPDSFVRKHGAEGMGGRIEAAADAVNHLVLEATARAGGPEAPAPARREVLQELGRTLRQIKIGSLRDMYVDQAARALGMDRATGERILREGAASTPSSSSHTSTSSSSSSPTVERLRRMGTELEVAALLFEHPRLGPEALAAGVEGALRQCDEELGPPLADLVVRLAGRDEGSSAADLLDTLPPPLRERLAKSSVSGKYQRLEEPAGALSEMLETLARDRVHRQLSAARRELGEAERAQDTGKQQEILQRIVELRRLSEQALG